MPSLTWFHWLLSGGIVTLALVSAGHALLNKRDPRAGLGWVYLCLTFPLVGPFLYSLFGVNRIRTLGRRLRRGSPGEVGNTLVLPRLPEAMLEIVKVSDAVTRQPLVGGNRVRPLFNGEEAYPSMLSAIESAKSSVYLLTYILDMDEVGRSFVAALARAAQRGVDVRVLIDGIGELYSLTHAGRALARNGVTVERFLRPRLVPPRLSLNLRNHRKILVVDHTIGFTGGMNIGMRHLVTAPKNRWRTVDVHFEVLGPVVAQLVSSFLEDWRFATGRDEELAIAAPAQAGTAWCRGVNDGPNEDYDRLTWILLGAINAARERVRVMTPYFVPTPELVAALNNAALRSVAVDGVLPEKGNLRFVDWASRAMLPEMLEYGVRFHLQAGPFVHSKFLLVDDEFALIGSANLDPRSLKLNFEFNLEVFDRELVGHLDRHFEAARSGARALTLQELAARPLPVRLRDATARLFSPYL